MTMFKATQIVVKKQETFFQLCFLEIRKREQVYEFKQI